jgi:hypothetical protein
MKCNLPHFLKDHIKITSWLDEPNHNIYPSLEGDSKFHMLPTGELLISNVTYSDSQKSFRCRTLNLLSQDVIASSSVGKIQISGKLFS